MNILILNWRGINDPLSGGAERVTFKYANYWAQSGHKVTWVTSKNTNYNQKVNKHTNLSFVYLATNLQRQKYTFVFRYIYYLLSVIFFLLYKKITRFKVDKVIDEIHGLPNFAVLFYPKKTILLTCEVAGKEIWHKMFKYPVSNIGLFVEKIIYHIYQKNEIWAISHNTKKDILKLNPKCKVKILPLGLDPITKNFSFKKNNYPSAVFVARVVKMKGVETALKATKYIVKSYPKFRLKIIGRGEFEYIKWLELLCDKYKIQRNVEFLGFVSEGEKYDILSKSHFLFHPSYKEGFGLTVLEAGLVKTPSIVRGGSSLDELVINKETGVIINNSKDICTEFIKYYKSKEYSNLCLNAYKNSKKYLWPTILKNSDKVTGV